MKFHACNRRVFTWMKCIIAFVEEALWVRGAWCAKVIFESSGVLRGAFADVHVGIFLDSASPIACASCPYDVDHHYPGPEDQHYFR